MNAHLLIIAKDALEEAVALTTAEDERNLIISAHSMVSRALAKRGIFVGEKTKPVIVDIGELYYEQDGDREPMDTYICRRGEGRILTLHGSSTIQLKHRAARIVNVMNAARLKDPKLIKASPLLLDALRRAIDHLIMSGTKCTDAPQALAQAREAVAAAKGT